MAVIKKYIEFLREYNKLLERGSKNVYRQKDILWVSDVENTSIVKQIHFETLFTERKETSIIGSLFKVKRPDPILEEDFGDEELVEKKFERDSYSFLYKAARDSIKDTGLEFVFSFGLFNIGLGEDRVKAHLFNIPLKASLLDSNVSFQLSDQFDPYIDAYFLNHPEINRDILESVTDDFDKGITEEGVAYLYSTEFKKLISKNLLALHQSLVFDPTVRKPNESLTNSFISFSPCFILRRKRPRHFQNLMNKIIEFTDENNPELNILDILLNQRDNMVTDEKAYFSQLYNDHKEEIEHLEPSDFEAFFPLPYNNEQLTIYQNYKTHDLSVVTGPPGTGKSHSIVNLLCAILAEGKRVLITAKTDKALESLLNKIPEQFSGLVMADINQQHGADYTLSNSIDSIRDLLLNNSMYSLERDLTKLNDEKRQYVERRTEMVRALNREYEPIKIEHFNKEFDVYGLFEFLRNRYSEYEWIKDEITTDVLKDNIEIIKKIKKLLTLKNFIKKECKLDLEQFESELKTIDFDEIADFRKEQQNSLDLLSINSLKEYHHAGIDIILSNFSDYKNQQIKVTDIEILNRILDKCKEQVRIVDNIYVNCDPQELLENRAQYKQDISTYLALIPKDKEKFTLIQRTLNSKCKSLKYLENITINDSFCDNKNSLIAFRKFIEDFSILNRQVDVLSQNYFLDYAPVSQLSLTEMHKKIVEGVNKAKINWDILEITNRKEVKSFAKHYQIGDTDIEKLFEKAESLRTILNDTLVIKTKLEDVLIAVEESRERLTEIGVKELENNADVEKTKDKIAIIRRHHSDYVTFDSAKKFLAEKLPETTAYLLKITDNDSEDYNLESLHLKLASYKIKDVTSLDIEKIIQKLNYSFKSIQDTKANILSGLAKENFKNRFNEREKNEFINLLTTFDREFKQSRRGIKDKEKFRRKAQQTAQKIAPNISCWVMKFDDVLKTIDERPQTFDCIIVDEASQLDFNSLLLGYYAQKMIVVGDEKQTSPENISIKDESFDSLRKRELSFMGDGAIHIRADASLFSLSQMVAGTTNLMLKEHFRCVPELIEFSKKHYYNDKIIPLKVISANRLKPKIVEYVNDGFVFNKEVPREIEAIRNKLIEILSNPRYEDKSIGVVSLGSANHTRSLKAILETLPQRKLEKHNLIIDNPSEFQGDERDVIIVSLGVAIEADIRGNIKQPISIVDNIENNLTPKLRGINVGLSRAKEQMILFHSVKLEELKANDFRRHIISFFNERYNPVEPFDLPLDLEKRYRMFENRPAPFDSWFEYDIAKALIENGYLNIVPQFEVKRKELFENPKTGKTTYVHFKIDIVVYHNGMPLAIECDGDAFHSEVDDVAYDIERQEFLQRIGWKIHRITYSSYRIDSKKEIEKLIDFIKRNSPKEAPALDTIKQADEVPERNDEPNGNQVQNDEPSGNISKQIIPTKTISKPLEEKRSKHRKFNKPDIITPSIKQDLFSGSYETIESKSPSQTTLFSTNEMQEEKKSHVKKIVEINSTCDIIMLDSNNKRYKIMLKDIARNLKSNTDEDILIVSIYDDLGKILLGNREGVTVHFPQRKQRIKIEKIY